jgi:large subunit ribosomal protein L6
MSRIGKLPVKIPAGVEVAEKARTVTVKGPKGSLQIELRPEIDVSIDGGVLRVEPNGSGGARESRAFHGLTRALINNMVEGVSKGYEKKLEIIGVGWNAKAQGKQITLNIGFCHPVVLDVPEGLQVETPKPLNITITGADKQAVGQLAASIRAIRPPEPYKGKGIRYSDEHVRRLAGKSFAGGAS